MKVLLVEDYAELRTLLATFLRRRGHDVAAVATPAEALAQVGSLTPALAILDYRLPDMDGVDLGRRIQQQSPVTRIVICSASDAREFEGANELERAGFGYVDKATLPGALDNLIAQSES